MRSQLEIAGVLLAFVLHFVLTHGVGVHGLDILPIGICCLVYALYRGRDPAARAAWGLQRAGLRAASADAAIFVGIGATLCAAFAVSRGALVFDLHLLVPLLLYPLWGLAQQFLVLGLVANNLDILGLRRPWVLGLTTLGFVAAHIPNWPLCAASAVLGLVSTLLFFRHRNLWPLGAAHGVLAALFYRWVLGRDVWLELLQHRV